MPTVARALHGYVNVLKPPAISSHDVVAFVRRISGQERVGHTGTLDPAAVGVLPIALGRATPTVGDPLWDRKLYWADVQFGARTTTDDGEGDVVESGSPDQLTLPDLRSALDEMAGGISQAPPAVSAIHVGGERAYAQVRRGAAVTLGARHVWIDRIDVVGWDTPRLSLLVACRSGTYIRSIARDLGIAVGCPAHLGALVRLRVGPFDVREALDLDELQAVAAGNQWDSVLMPVDLLSPGAPVLVVDEPRASDYLAGRNWPAASDSKVTAPAHVLSPHGDWLGFGELTEAGRWQPRRAPVTSRHENYA